MTLKLVKTIGGLDGSPDACAKCRSSNFMASGTSWYCGDCGLYCPTLLSLKKDIYNALRVLDEISKVTKKMESYLE